MNTISRSFLPLALLAVGRLAAQLPAHDAIATHNVLRTFTEATICVVQEDDRIHTFSTYLKKWFTMPASAAAVFYGYDDHVVVVDGNRVSALATRFGTYETLTTTGTPYVSTAPAPTALSVLTDGNTVYLFSAFTGTWAAVPFANPPIASLSKLVATVSDGTQTVGYSAMYGTPVSLSGSGVTQVVAMGYGGYALAPGLVSFFSAPRNSWRTEPMAATATVLTPPARAATFIVQTGPLYQLWSAFTDTIDYLGGSGAEVLGYGDVATVFVDGAMAFGYSATTGTVVPLTLQSPGLQLRSSYWASVADGTDLHVFSGVTGTWSTLTDGVNATPYTNALSAACVMVDAVGAAHCYSAVTGQWHAAPAMPTPSVRLTYAGAVFEEPTVGCVGFSALHGTFSTLPGVLPTRSVQFGGNYVCESAAGLHVFNPHAPGWRSQALSAPAGALRAHHAAVIAEDGTSVYFYGTYDDRWTRVFVGSAPSLAVADEVGSFVAGNYVCAFGGSGQLGNEVHFPQWWRVLTRGSRVAWHVAGEVGALAGLIVSLGAGDTMIPGVGRLLVDPGSAFALLMGPIPFVGMARLDWTVPDVPAAHGLVLHTQAAVLRAQGAYLTNVFRTPIF